MAVPTAPRSTCRDLEREVDEAVCVMTPEPFFGVGQWYTDFSQTTDGEVIDLLRARRRLRPGRNRGRRRRGEQAVSVFPATQTRQVEIAVGRGHPARRPRTGPRGRRTGALRPRQRQQPLQFAQPGSGPTTCAMPGSPPCSSTSSPRSEERIDELTRELRFDIALLTERVIGVTEWLRRQPETSRLGIGYFGASTGAAAALQAAAHFADRPGVVKAVVSRGGRPDLAMEALPLVKAPTLAHRRRRGPGGHRHEPAGLRRDRRAQGAAHRARRLSSLRGAGHAGGGLASRSGVVPPPPWIGGATLAGGAGSASGAGRLSARVLPPAPGPAGPARPTVARAGDRASQAGPRTRASPSPGG